MRDLRWVLSLYSGFKGVLGRQHKQGRVQSGGCCGRERKERAGGGSLWSDGSEALCKRLMRQRRHGTQVSSVERWGASME